MPFPPEVPDQLLKDCKTPEEMFGSHGLLHTRVEHRQRFGLLDGG